MQICLENLLGEMKKYHSLDTVREIGSIVHYQEFFLKSLYPAGLSSGILKFKIWASIILFRNLNLPTVCNGTIIQIKSYP